MIRANVTNLIQNGNFENSVLRDLALNGANTTASFQAGGAAIGGVFRRHTLTAERDLYFCGLYKIAYIPAVVGDKFAMSFYFRPSVPANTRIAMEQRDAAHGGTTIVYGPLVACPANVWTRLSGVLKVTKLDTAVVRPVFYTNSVVGGGVAPIGTTLDFDGLMMTKTDSVTDYFDGDSPEWQWDGTAKASTSHGPVMLDVKPKVLCESINYSRNPVARSDLQFLGFQRSASHSTNPTLRRNDNDPSPVGMTSATIRTESDGSWYRMWIGSGNGSDLNYTPVNPGDVMHLSSLVKHTRALPLHYVVVWRGITSPAPPQFNGTNFPTKADDFTSLEQSVPVPANAKGAYVCVEVNSGLTGDEFTVTGMSINRKHKESFFDGSSADAEWVGEADASFSKKPAFVPADVLIFTGTEWINAG